MQVVKKEAENVLKNRAAQRCAPTAAASPFRHCILESILCDFGVTRIFDTTAFLAAAVWPGWKGQKKAGSGVEKILESKKGPDKDETHGKQITLGTVLYYFTT